MKISSEKAMIVLVIVVSIIFIDTRKSHAFDLVEAGDYGQFATLGLSLILITDKEDAEGLEQLSKSTLFGMGVVYGLKYSVNSERPNKGEHSFPSGHTAAAVLGAEFLRKRYGWKWGLIGYADAVMVGYSRVHGKYHWPIDVAGAFGVAIFSNWIFVEKYNYPIALDCLIDHEKANYDLKFRVNF